MLIPPAYLYGTGAKSGEHETHVEYHAYISYTWCMARVTRAMSVPRFEEKIKLTYFPANGWLVSPLLAK